MSAVSPCVEVGFCEALRCCAPRFAKRVPYRFAHMNRAEGSHAARTNGHSYGTALSPQQHHWSSHGHSLEPGPSRRRSLRGRPASQRVARRALARCKTQPLSQIYNPTRHGDPLTLALWLHLYLPLTNQIVGCNTPLRIAPIPTARPPPIHNTSQIPNTNHTLCPWRCPSLTG